MQFLIRSKIANFSKQYGVSELTFPEILVDDSISGVVLAVPLTSCKNGLSNGFR